MSERKDGREHPAPMTDELEAKALELFAQSLDEPAAQRRKWVARQCADQPELMSAVVQLLDAENEGGDFLSASPLRADALADAIEDDRVGEQLGPYRLVARIGSGGMGTVYRASRVDGAFEQEVAIKLMRAGFANEESVQRFVAERQILARLQHPGIARLLDGGKDSSGAPYVVMELIDGQPIHLYCNEEGLDLNARLRLVQQVCEALGAAHALGIVHRDIKPGNILVDTEGQPKLLDFGIAKVTGGDDFGAALPRTRTGMAAMTPQYASPEQVRGEAVSPASDIYALGVLMYELVTGAHPYSVQTMSPADAQRAICLSVPADPSVAVGRRRDDTPTGMPSGKTLQRSLRGDLDRIVMTTLRKQPANRYPSAAALAGDIERYLTGLPVKARGASRWYRARKFAARHAVAVSATAFAFAVLVAALVLVSLQVREAQRQRDLAQQEAQRAESAKTFLFEMISRADPFADSESATLIDALKASIDSIDERFAGQPALEAEMRYQIGYALQNLGDIPPARAQLERALDLRRTHGTPFEQAQVLDALGIVCWWESDYARGEQRFLEAMSLIESESSQASTALKVDILTNLGGMLNEPGEYNKSIPYLKRAADLARSLPISANSAKATLYNNMATAQESAGHYDDALLSFEKSLALRRGADGELNPDYAITLNNQSFLFVNMGDYDKAAEVLKKSIEIERQLLGSQHPELCATLMNLAWVQTGADRSMDAISHAREALGICKSAYPPGHIRTGKAHETLAGALLKNGDHDEAMSEVQRALQIYRAAETVHPGWMEAAEDILAALDAAAISKSADGTNELPVQEPVQEQP